MAGNVWEWCTTRSQVYGESYSALKGENEWSDQYLEGKDARVLRGGSFGVGARDVRGASRYWYGPGLRGRNRGFRCAQSVWP